MKTLKILFLLIWLPMSAHALTDGAFYGGLGYFAENNFGKITKANSAAKATLGSETYPLMVRYDWAWGTETFFTPTFTYTIFDRKDAADSAKVNIWHLMLPLSVAYHGGAWEWSIGPGLLNRKIKGAGGTTVLSNGTGTATFALPGRTVQSRNLTMNFGSAFNYGSSRLGLDLMIEGISSEKRNYNIMLSYAYAFATRGY